MRYEKSVPQRTNKKFHARKIIKLHTSYYINLPMDFMVRNLIRPGEPLIIEESLQEGTLLIRRPNLDQD